MKSPLSSLISSCVVCIVAVVSYSVWYAVISEKSTRATELQNQIDAKTETVNRIAATRATLAGVGSDETVVQGYFVPETGVVAFIASLEAHGRILGAVVSVLSVEKSGTVARPTLALTLTMNGTFDAVMRTVGTIEYAPYDITISSLEVVQNGKNNWQANLKIVVGSVPATRTTLTP